MNVDPDIFREYDIRGIVGTQLTEQMAEHLGRAVGTTVQKGGGSRIVVGADCRQSGTWLKKAFIAGVCASGCDTEDIGVGPTPLGYWAIRHLKADGGVHITGSHNPPEYNGFKLTLLGQSLHGSAIAALRDMMANEAYARGHAKNHMAPVCQAYIDDLARLLRPAQRRLKVVIDAGNGTGGLTAKPLYEKLGYEVIPMYCEMDGTFPHHHPDPSVEENVADLKVAVQKHKADVGLAFDGDADRVGVIDNAGQIVWGDKLMVLLSRAVLQERPGACIIGEVKCSKVLYDDIRAHGGRGLMWRTGHSLIKQKMKEENAELAGEVSGHIFFKHRYYGFDDGVYAGARLLELLSESPLSLAESFKDLPYTVATPEIRIDCPDAIKFKVVAAACAYFKENAQRGGYTVIDIDGARVEWPDAWGLVRCSNTTPILVLRFEAPNDARLNEVRSLFEREIARIKASLG